MRIGLFGKLPAKRDYIAHGVDRAFLELWEPWLQGAIAASRDRLRDAWLPAYMNAPIWRFWLGPGLCGETVAGALMPSVDGVGRYFPLCLAARGIDMAPPGLDAQAAWFGAAEAVLLDALEEGRPFDATLAAAAALPPPALPVPGSVEAAFAAIRHEAEPEFHDGLSLWWVRPVAGTEIRAMIRRGMPGPYDYIEMLRPLEEPPAPPAPEPEPLVLTELHQAAGAAAGAGLWDADIPAPEPAPDPPLPASAAAETPGTAAGQVPAEALPADAETPVAETPDPETAVDDELPAGAAEPVPEPAPALPEGDDAMSGADEDGVGDDASAADDGADGAGASEAGTEREAAEAKDDDGDDDGANEDGDEPASGPDTVVKTDV